MSLFSGPSERTDAMMKKYLLIRNLMERSNYYVFEHEKHKIARLGADTGVSINYSSSGNSEEYIKGYIKLFEIGSLNGRKGKFNIFGVLFKAHGKYYMQDRFNKITIDLNKCEGSLGFVLESFMVVAMGSIEYNVFMVERFLQPIVNKKEIDASLDKEIRDIFGARTKFLSIMGKLTKFSAQDDRRTKNEKLDG
jgi:hypothetical protein